jgi:hypothetical protein
LKILAGRIALPLGLDKGLNQALENWYQNKKFKIYVRKIITLEGRILMSTIGLFLLFWFLEYSSKSISQNL